MRDPRRQPECHGPFDGASRLCGLCERHPEDPLKPCSRLVAESPTMRAVLRRAIPMAACDAPVVIQGETGTGKEVLARSLHAGGKRSGGPFVAVNCAAIPGELVESELFGHARGAFSGAVSDRRGLFEEASGGTLLLDEIAEIPVSLQAKLLRVLQEGEVRRVGSNRSVAVDVRVLAATHQDLQARVRTGAFREDLYYRLKVFSLRLPPLRERTQDILPLARQILVHLPGVATGFEPEAREALLAYGWPGNVRELGNAMRHAAALAHGVDVCLEDLPEEVASPLVAGATAPAPHGGNGSNGTTRPALETLAEVERRHVLAVLDACRGNQAEAARILGIARNTLWRKLEAYHRAEDGGEAPRPDPC
ncbi:MAG: sigma-54 dependent transcriptional regulator [Anaeromyxobacteraceae bacterium]